MDMQPPTMTQIIDRKRYNTETATLLSGNDWWDGNNYERSGRNTFLYRTPKGAYFVAELTRWQGEADGLRVVDRDEAIEMFEEHAARDQNRVEFEEAFPGVEVEEA